MPVVILEFNELTPRLMDQFIEEGRLPGFKRLRERSTVAVTDAEEEGENLNPWVQWVSIHTGLPFEQHKVFDLGDGPKFKHPRLWDRISAAGRKVWVCGSMNASIEGDHINGMVLPDPWVIGIAPQPAGVFDAYYDLVSTYVQNHTADKPPVSRSAYMKFARFMVGNGLSLKTTFEALRQLSGERTVGVGRWKRAAILDRLQWDIFRHHYRRMRPTLATFFLNSTAHLQHYHWRNLEPSQFQVQPPEKEQQEYADAILFGYQKMDEIVQECLDLVSPDTTVILCTALSQQPLLKYEADGGKQLYKPFDHAALTAFAGITDPYVYEPVMAEQFHLRFDNEVLADAARDKLMALNVDGHGGSIMEIRREGAMLVTQCIVGQPPAEEAMVTSRIHNNSLPFHALFFTSGELRRADGITRTGFFGSAPPNTAIRSSIARFPCWK